MKNRPAVRCRLGLIGVLVLAAGSVIAIDAAKMSSDARGKVDFTRDVRPILANHCFKCHGPDEVARKGKLRLDVRDEAIKPGKSEEIPIVPGKPDKSELVERVFTENEDDVMPPPATKKPLTSEQKDILKRWIAEGAEYKEHWSFVPPKQVKLPKVLDRAWPRNAIDHFVLARLEKEGLKPSRAADKYTLVRRVYLDLIGLPPTPEQADAFVNDKSPGAYEKLVDGLLASPHYGERWARRWLDLARYADTNGYEKDRPRSIWHWRDWVIRSINEDMPFDEFTLEQLAGDMLPHATQNQIVATGFHRNTMINEEGGVDTLEYRFLSMVDRVHVTSTAWLGLTMACAQCHTHKYDPIQHSEYYRFMAFLNNAVEPTIPVVAPDIAEKRKKNQEQVAALEAALPTKYPLEVKIAWQTPGVALFTSQEGLEGEFLNDGSFRVTGKKPDKDVYTIKLEAGVQRITHVQLEAMPDEKISNGGPGYGAAGNFVLSEFEMEWQEQGESGRLHRIKFESVKADHSQDGLPVENTIDGKHDTGWGIAAKEGKNQRHRHAIFTLAEPLELKKPAGITIRLVQNYGGNQLLGRFRISLGNELPESFVSEERRRELRDQGFQKWIRTQLPNIATWTQLRPVAVTSSAPILTLQEDNSVFASGDFTKSDHYTLVFRNLPAGLKAIRLEMLPDERLPKGGPGSVNHEGPEGDFWLSSLKVRSDGATIVLTNASESFASEKNDAAKAIDDDLQSGWSINGGQGKTHNAVFQFTQSVTSTNELRLEMVCEKYYASGLGRFRVWVTAEDNAKASGLENDAVARLVKLQREDKLDSLFAKTNATPERELLFKQFARLSPDYARSRREIEKLRKEAPEFSTTLVMQERPAGNERPTFRHHRGEFLQPKEEVTAGVPAFLPQLPEKSPKNRVALAKWLVSAKNPLTSRVVMNRHWEAFFGRGLVRTTEDFGFQGESPSHPELLDWLAVEFPKQRWSQKKMHKLIVMSATYQQASDVTAELRERDPSNVLFTRGPRLRMDAEMVRDAALVASGLFSDKIGGPSVYPPQPAGVTSEGTYGALDWKTSEGPDRYRRGLYTFAKRTAPYAMTATFDGPSGEACLARRERSNTPLQALTLLNDPAFLEFARALGKMAANADGDDSKRVDLLVRRCLTRPVSEDEKAKLAEFYQAQLARFTKGELKVGEILDVKEGERLNEQAAWATVARVLMNLDDAITKS